MTGYLWLPNWRELQHFTKAAPPWIKHYVLDLDNMDFRALPDDAKGHLQSIRLVASRHDGRIPNDPEYIRNRIGAKSPVDLDALVAGGFLLREPPVERPKTPKITTRRVSAPRVRQSQRQSHKKPIANAEPQNSTSHLERIGSLACVTCGLVPFEPGTHPTSLRDSKVFCQCPKIAVAS